MVTYTVLKVANRKHISYLNPFSLSESQCYTKGKKIERKIVDSKFRLKHYIISGY